MMLRTDHQNVMLANKKKKTCHEVDFVVPIEHGLKMNTVVYHLPFQHNELFHESDQKSRSYC